MKLKQEESFVLTNSTNERAFTIAATGKAFKILSSSLYSRKIEAIVRELSCNAYDSHVMAGCQDKPFKVCLPNIWLPEFSIEDFGVGLDKDDVEQIYTSYFTSTKTDSNDVIGALGLGSKTPFAYTDSFSLISRKDGKEYSYSAYINAKGEPSVTLLAESDTDKPNGVKVSVPVASKDFHEFGYSCQRVYKYFRVLPEIEGSEDYDISQINFNKLDEQGYMLLEKSKNNTVYALMGNVCYEVTNISTTFLDKLSDTVGLYMKNVSLIIKFEIGDLDVAASRETVSFDPETEANFLNRLHTVAESLIANIQSEVELMTSPEEALHYVSSMIGDWANKIITYRGRTIKDWQDTRHSDIVEECTIEYYKPRYFPKVMANQKGQVMLHSGMPMFTSYDHAMDLHPEVFYFSPRKHTLQRSTFSVKFGHGTSSKLYIFEGSSEPTYEITVKEKFRELVGGYVGSSYVLKYFAGAMIFYDYIPKELKDRLLHHLGEGVVFMDTAQLIEERKARIKAEHAKRKALRQIENKPKKQRIKKDQVRIVRSYDLSISDGISVNREDQMREVYVDDITTPFLLLHKDGSDIDLLDCDGKCIQSINQYTVAPLMLLTGVHTMIVVKREKDIEVLKSKATCPRKVTEPYIKAFTSAVDEDRVLDLLKTNKLQLAANLYVSRYKKINELNLRVTEFKNLAKFCKVVVDKYKDNIEALGEVCRYVNLIHDYNSRTGWSSIYLLSPSSMCQNEAQYKIDNYIKSIEDEVNALMKKDPILEYLCAESRLDLADIYVDKAGLL